MSYFIPDKSIQIIKEKKDQIEWIYILSLSYLSKYLNVFSKGTVRAKLWQLEPYMQKEFKKYKPMQRWKQCPPLHAHELCYFYFSTFFHCAAFRQSTNANFCMQEWRTAWPNVSIFVLFCATFAAKRLHWRLRKACDLTGDLTYLNLKIIMFWVLYLLKILKNSREI